MDVEQLPYATRESGRKIPNVYRKQGQYLAFIYYYTKINGQPPAEADMQRYFRTTPPICSSNDLKVRRAWLYCKYLGELALLLPTTTGAVTATQATIGNGLPRNKDNVKGVQPCRW
ncbi:MAG: hypothetical protein R3E79_59905 [Caldilineaceae bacterium]